MCGASAEIRREAWGVKRSDAARFLKQSSTSRNPGARKERDANLLKRRVRIINRVQERDMKFI